MGSVFPVLEVVVWSWSLEYLAEQGIFYVVVDVLVATGFFEFVVWLAFLVWALEFAGALQEE